MRCKELATGKKKFRFKNKLFSFDATVIELCASLYDWAKYRQTKGAVKLHLLLDHEGYLAVFAHVTGGKMHEVNVARSMFFPKGSIVVMDRGYVDYRLFSDWTERGVYFVTRMKDNARYRVIEEKEVPKRRNILKYEVIEFEGDKAREDCWYQLRRIEVWEEDKGERIVLLTNRHEFGATTIWAIYKDRWQTEIFFKMIKQNLKIKSIVGTSFNAVMIQIWTALISILVLRYLKFKSRYSWSLSNLVAMFLILKMQKNLYKRLDLSRWFL